MSHFSSMAQPGALLTDSQDPPIYTEGAPLIWLNFGVPGRFIEVCPLYHIGKATIPITPKLYASLHKVNCLVANRISEPDGLRQLSESIGEWAGLSGLLLYTTTIIIRINEGIFFRF